MTNQFPCDRAYRPPMPAMVVRLGRPGGEPTPGPLAAILDTGADATLVPIEYIKQLKAPKVDKSRLRSSWGERRPIFVYAITLQIGAHQFSAIRVVGDETGNEIVVGRNVLNLLRVLLDGPALVTQLE